MAVSSGIFDNRFQHADNLSKIDRRLLWHCLFPRFRENAATCTKGISERPSSHPINPWNVHDDEEEDQDRVEPSTQWNVGRRRQRPTESSPGQWFNDRAQWANGASDQAGRDSRRGWKTVRDEESEESTTGRQGKEADANGTLVRRPSPPARDSIG